jgi:hypothetical protein
MQVIEVLSGKDKEEEPKKNIKKKKEFKTW